MLINSDRTKQQNPGSFCSKNIPWEGTHTPSELPATNYIATMEMTRNPEALLQTPEQKTAGTVTYRVFLDNAWRNIEGQASWTNLDPKQLISKLEEVYFTPK